MIRPIIVSWQINADNLNHAGGQEDPDSLPVPDGYGLSRFSRSLYSLLLIPDKGAGLEDGRSICRQPGYAMLRYAMARARV